MSKILSIVWYKVLPPVFGGQKGIAGFNKHLATHHSLVCLCSKNNGPADDLFYKLLPELPTGKFQFINPFVWCRIRSVAKKEKPTHIICEHPYHGIAAFLAAKATNAKLVVHSHNIESERFRQAGKFWWRILRMYERWVHRKAGFNLFKTDADKSFAIRQWNLAETKCIVIPYGIERPVLNPTAGKLIRQRHGIAENEKIFLFAGTLDYEPNAVAVKNIYSKIVPQLESSGISYKIIICGRNRTPAFNYLNDLSHHSVINTGEVNDIENYFQAADVFINPVQSGGGVQTKNIDALASHCTVVCFESMPGSTPSFLLNTKILVAGDDNWDNFATMIIAATKRKQDTPESFFRLFSWENTVADFLQTITTTSLQNNSCHQ